MWLKQFNLIYRSSVKYNMSADLSIEMTEHLEYFLPIQSVNSTPPFYLITHIYILIIKISTLIFYQFANGGTWGLSSIVGICLGLLHAFLPM